MYMYIFAQIGGWAKSNNPPPPPALGPKKGTFGHNRKGLAIRTLFPNPYSRF